MMMTWGVVLLALELASTSVSTAPRGPYLPVAVRRAATVWFWQCDTRAVERLKRECLRDGGRL
jgi:hypothetical protein